MTAIFPALLVVIILACAASLFSEGLWGNLLNLINVMLAGLLAFNFFEPLAKWFEGMMPKIAFAVDYLSLWLVFSLSLFVLRQITNMTSRVKVRFLGVVDRTGSGILAVLVGWMLVCFTTASLHTAPLGRNFLWGGFNPENKMLGGLAPDRQWLGLVKMASRGGFSRGNEFDPDNRFIVKYADFRSILEEHAKEKKSILVDSGSSPIPARGREASSGE